LPNLDSNQTTPAFIRVANLPDLNEDNKSELAYLLFCWCLQLIDSTEVRVKFRESCTALGLLKKRYISDGDAPSVKMTPDITRQINAVRWQLFYDFDSTKLKLAALKAGVYKASSFQAARAVFNDYGLPEVAAEHYAMMLADRDMSSRFYQRLHDLANPSVLSDLQLDQIKLVREYEQDFARRKLKQAAYATAHRHLSFLAAYNNYTVEDYAADLIVRSTAYYYQQRPFKSRLHATNYAKGSVTIGAYKIIQAGTTGDNCRVQQGVGDQDAYNRIIPFTDTISNLCSTDVSLDVPLRLPRVSQHAGAM
jgi:hypothetical protein